jgi:hypothetical protein
MSALCLPSLGVELTLCYAEQRSSQLYRLLSRRVSWDTQVGLECKNVAVVPALLTAAELLSPSLTLASPRPSSTSSLHLLLDVDNTSDSTFELSLTLDGLTSAQSHHIRRRSVRRSVTHGYSQSSMCILSPSRAHPCVLSPICAFRLLLPLPFFSFGRTEDRHLLRLQTGESSLSPSALASLRQSCLARFTARVRLTWFCPEVSRRGVRRSGQLLAIPQLTLDQLATLLAPPVTFSCSCQLLGHGSSNEAAVPSPDPQSSVSPTSASLSAVAASRVTSTPSAAPFARTVGTVLMQEKLARALSVSAAASLSVRSDLTTSDASPLLSPVHSVSSSSGPLLLSGFGPHRIPVGSFVRLAVEVTNSSAVLGRVRLRLHLTADEAIGEAEAAFSLASSSSAGQRSASVIISGALSPVLPLLAPHQSVRHVFALCCLAKGRFAYRIHCTALAEEKGRLFDETNSRAQRLSQLQQLAMRSAEPSLSEGPSTVRMIRFESDGHAQGREDDDGAPRWFPCPHRLVLDAVV